VSIDLDDPVAVLLAAQRAFERAGLQAVAYGGLVVAMYGRPRETHDADFAVSTVSPEGARHALTAAGLDVVQAFAEVRFGGCSVSRLTLVGGGELNTVDLVRPRSPRYAAAVLERAISGTLRGETVRVTTPEDYVLLKVLATRDRDLEDAASVIEKQRGRLDWPLLEREVAALASEIPDHDVAGRYNAVTAVPEPPRG
jgi:hypothetical protein